MECYTRARLNTILRANRHVVVEWKLVMIPIEQQEEAAAAGSYYWWQSHTNHKRTTSHHYSIHAISCFYESKMSNDNIHRYKIVILGDTGVGKTSLAVRFVRDAFRKFETTTGGMYTLLTMSSYITHTPSS